ncbi:uncharacterized protein LOC142644925 isoform X2 [Dermatophagoides pteronyssinus]|uniref:uncharacterized protein LOC142644925 isoform X2 n=1 Tax=Dermatophagoides pteronyssinus TaxID=6956 RepID=UPI003F66AFA5
MKFYPQRLFNVQTHRNQLESFRKCCHFTLCHSCWCSFIIGIILLIIGIILICNIIHTSHYNLIIGIFFLIISSIILISSPMMALFEYNIERKRSLSTAVTTMATTTTRNHPQRRSTSSILVASHPIIITTATATTSNQRSINNLNDNLPDYDDIDKHSVPIHYVYRSSSSSYPRRSTNHDQSSIDQLPPPPTYNEIISQQQNDQNNQPTIERSSVDQIATIEPSQIINRIIV